LKRLLLGLFGAVLMGNAMYVINIVDTGPAFESFADLFDSIPVMIVCMVNIYVGLVLIKFGLHGDE